MIEKNVSNLLFKLISCIFNLNRSYVFRMLNVDIILVDFMPVKSQIELISTKRKYSF